MATKHITIHQLPDELKKDLRLVRLRVLNATWKTAKRGVGILKEAAPRAFGELGDSVHDLPRNWGATIRIDAPHAASIEKGSRAHMPPVEAIEKWVELRGIEALTLPRPGRAARSVLRALRKAGGLLKRRGKPLLLMMDAVRSVAWAIAMKIKKKGTKPQPFVRASMPFIVIVLDDEIRAALEQAAPST